MKALSGRGLWLRAFACLLTVSAASATFAAERARAWRPWNGQIPPPPEHVTVKRGDTLSGYAGKYLWPLIWLYNKDTIENPHLIYPREQVKIPPNNGFVGGGGPVKTGTYYGPPIGKVLFSTPGEVRYKRVNGDEFQVIAGDDLYGAGTILTESGAALIRLVDATTVKVFDHSQVTINEAAKDKDKGSTYQLMDQLQGKVVYMLPKYPDSNFRFEVKTAVATIDPLSRRFQVDIAPGSDTRIASFDGKLRVVGRSRFVDVPVDHGVAISPDGKRMAEVKLPQTPVMVSPTGVTGTTVVFAWKQVPDAQRYNIQIGADREIVDLVFIGTVYDDTKFEMDIRNAADYYWIVESVNDLGFSSAPQNPMRFTVSNQFVGLPSEK